MTALQADSDGTSPALASTGRAPLLADASMDASHDCVICNILESPRPKWHDQILACSGEFAVIPGLGAQRAGYLLVVPRQHATSLRELSDESLDDLTRLVRHIRQRLGDAYGPYVAFEHGSCRGRARGGSCVEHAHLHLLPAAERIDLLALRDRPFHRVAGFTSLRSLPEQPYLALETQFGSLLVGSGECAPGQYFRRLVGDAIGQELTWDYAAFPNYDLVGHTVERVGRALSDLHV